VPARPASFWLLSPDGYSMPQVGVALRNSVVKMGHPELRLLVAVTHFLGTFVLLGFYLRYM
jgi:hypothetical protein